MTTLTKKEEKQAEAKEKRSKLYADAAYLKSLRNLEPEKYEGKTINQMLVYYYGLDGKELKTFRQWKEAGYSVKKGQKGFAFFSAPKGKNQDALDPNERGRTQHYIAYLFSSEQVEKIEGGEK